MAKKSLASLKIPRSYNLKTSGISQSQVREFTTCRMKWLFYINKLKPMGETIATTNFGSLFHKLLEKSYSLIDAKTKYTDLRPRVQKWLDKYIKDNTDKLDVQSLETEGGMAERVLYEYLTVYKSDFTTQKTVGCEKDLHVLWNREYGTFLLKTIVDQLYVDRKGFLWLKETKTKSRIDEDGVVGQLSMDFQNLFSLTILNSCIKDGVRGVLYDIVRKPQLRRKQNESLLDFQNRCTEDIQARPEFYFKRMEVVYTKKDLQNFQENELREYLSQILDVCNGASKVVKNSFQCIGMYKCKYLEACSSNDYSCLVKADKRK